MSISESQRQASYKYRAKNIKRVPLDMQNEEYEKLKAAAIAARESVNGYIKRAIEMRMDAEKADTGIAAPATDTDTGKEG